MVLHFSWLLNTQICCHFLWCMRPTLSTAGLGGVEVLHSRLRSRVESLHLKYPSGRFCRATLHTFAQVLYLNLVQYTLHYNKYVAMNGARRKMHSQFLLRKVFSHLRVYFMMLLNGVKKSLAAPIRYGALKRNNMHSIDRFNIQCL